jgi:dynein heavy chain
MSVSPRHVLFAAHCLTKAVKNNKKSDSYFYFANDYDTVADDFDLNEIDDPAQAYISELIVHPDRDIKDNRYGADIAIAVLKKPVEISNKIRHICLNTPADPIQSLAGRNTQVFGWGLTKELKTVSELRHVSVPLVDQALCYNNSNPDLPKIMSDSSFCAGARDGKSGPCNGNELLILNSEAKFYELALQVTLAAGWSWKLMVCGN